MIYAAIVIGCVLLVAAVLGIPWLLDRHHQRRAEADLFGATQAASWQKAPPAPEMHHDWYAAPTDLVPGAGTRTPPVTTAAWPSAAYTLKADSPAPASTLAPAAPDATPKSGPAAGARAPEPPAGDEAPGPDGAPEGDEPAARPPQGTTGPGGLLAKAAAGIKALPVSDYLSEVQDATAWETRAPLAALLSDDTMTRAGFPPIKADA